jgi:uncharacterized protein
MRRTGQLFIPNRWDRPQVLIWLKRIHAWTGFWGALLFLLIGTSGFLLNHRQTLKIETPKPVEVSSVEIAVPPGAIRDGDGLAKWAQAKLSLPVEGREPPKDKRKPKAVLGKPVAEAERWTRVFNLHDTRLTIAYTPGSTSASVSTEALGILGTIKNLHKGTGLGIAWVLLIDTIAGALITMSLTGFLLWSNLHGRRLVAGAIVGTSLAWALLALP